MTSAARQPDRYDGHPASCYVLDKLSQEYYSTPPLVLPNEILTQSISCIFPLQLLFVALAVQHAPTLASWLPLFTSLS